MFGTLYGHELSNFLRLANQKPGFSHVTGRRRRSFLLGPPNFLPPDLQGARHRHKLHNFCARLNHFLGVYGEKEDYHRLRFFVLFVVVYFVFYVDALFMEKIAKEYCVFSAFLKKAKTCLMEMALAPSFFKLWGF